MSRRLPGTTLRVACGVTLVELVLIISLSALITGIVITAMAASFRFDDQNAQHRVDQSKLVRLARSLRAEIHQATACHWDHAEQSLTLELPGSRNIHYQLKEELWFRSQRVAEGESTITPLGISGVYRLESETESATQGELIEIRLNNKSAAKLDNARRSPRRRGFHIMAQVGRDYVPLHE